VHFNRLDETYTMVESNMNCDHFVEIDLTSGVTCLTGLHYWIGHRANQLVRLAGG
jgi:hypothetical protein